MENRAKERETQKTEPPIPLISPKPPPPIASSPSSDPPRRRPSPPLLPHRSYGGYRIRLIPHLPIPLTSHLSLSLHFVVNIFIMAPDCKVLLPLTRNTCIPCGRGVAGSY